VGARFSAPVQTGPGAPLSLLYNGYRVFPGGKERPGRDADPSPLSSGHERVELYLYTPYGPYGLYRASVPVQGCTSLYYKQQSSPLRSFFQSPVTFSVLDTNVRTNTPRLCPSLIWQTGFQQICI